MSQNVCVCVCASVPLFRIAPQCRGGGRGCGATARGTALGLGSWLPWDGVRDSGSSRVPNPLIWQRIQSREQAQASVMTTNSRFGQTVLPNRKPKPPDYRFPQCYCTSAQINRGGAAPHRLLPTALTVPRFTLRCAEITVQKLRNPGAKTHRRCGTTAVRFGTTRADAVPSVRCWVFRWLQQRSQ